MALYINGALPPKKLPRTTKPTLHGELCDVGVRWCLRTASQKGGCMSLAFAEIGAETVTEMPDVYGFDKRGETVVLEIKTSRSDFLADKRKEFRANPDLGMGDFRYYMCPKGVITEEDLAGTKWGLIYVSPKGICKVIRGKATNPTYSDTWRDQWLFKKNMVAETDLTRALFLRMSYNLDVSGYIDGLKAKSKLDNGIMRGCPVAQTVRSVTQANALDNLTSVMKTYGYDKVRAIGRVAVPRVKIQNRRVRT